MTNDRLVGSGILAGSIAVVIIYGLLMVHAWQITFVVAAFLTVALLIGTLAWTGYKMATTPPPEPTTEIPEVAPESNADAKGQKQP